MEGVGNILLAGGFQEKSEGEQSLGQETGGWNRKGGEVGIRAQVCGGKQGQPCCGLTSGAAITLYPTWVSRPGGPWEGPDHRAPCTPFFGACNFVQQAVESK